MSKARSYLNSILEWFESTRDEDTEDRETAAYEIPLSVEYRSGWTASTDVGEKHWEEYRVVLCTGGPHVELRGYRGRLEETQLWVTQWGVPEVELPMTRAESDAVESFLRYVLVDAE
jgi:hypothetical protein